MAAPVTMRYSPPPPHLADRISSLYELRQDVATYDEVERADRPQFRLLLSGSGHIEFAGGRRDPTYPVMLLGPTSAPIRGIGAGPAWCVGAGLLPPAWVSLTGTAAERLTDRVIDVATLIGDAAPRLHAAVLAAPDTDARFALLSAALDIATSPSDPAQLAFTRMVDAWLVDSADPEVEVLVASSGLSMRQLERMARRYYGLPPKTLARKYRALRAAAALARGEDLDASGLSDAFYDQSHLIREVKRFAGLTPQQIRARDSHLLAEMSEGRKSLTGRVGPLISDA